MWLYSLLLGTGLLLSSPWWLFRFVTRRHYREGLAERLGRIPGRIHAAVGNKQVIWIHAVSVGEVLAAAQLVEQLERTLTGTAAGAWQLVISTTTPAGQRLARERFGAERVFWFPLDLRSAVRKWLQVLRPSLLVLVESELWPRLLAECQARAVPVVVANARLSDRSFQRAMRFRPWWRRVLRNVDLFLAQGQETADRLLRLGVSPEVVRVTGNLKYDTHPRQSDLFHQLRPLLGRRLLLVAGSLLPGEEDTLLGVWSEICNSIPEAVLLLAPRHPERFDEVARLASRSFDLLRASRIGSGEGADSPDVDCAVILLDTIGDLAALYALADVAFVGGSLAPRGGHNPLEPARFGVPVVMGPSFFNFREIVAEMQAVRGIEIVANKAELSRTLARLLRDRIAADALGQQGQKVFAHRSGATDRTVEALVQVLGLPEAEALGKGKA